MMMRQGLRNFANIPKKAGRRNFATGQQPPVETPAGQAYRPNPNQHNTGNSMMAYAKPAIIVGGVGILGYFGYKYMFAEKSPSHMAHDARRDLEHKADHAKDKAADKAHDAKHYVSDKAHDAKHYASEKADKFADKAEDLKHKVASKAEDLKNKVVGKAEHAKDKAQDKAEEAKSKLGR